MASSLLALAKSIYYIYISTDRGVGGRGWGRGGEVPSRKLVVQSSCQYDVTSRAHVSDLQNGKQSSSKRRMKISNLSKKNCSDFLDLAI